MAGFSLYRKHELKVFFDNKCFINQRFGGISDYFSNLHFELRKNNSVRVINGGIFNYFNVKSETKINLTQKPNKFVRSLDQQATLLQLFCQKPDIFHTTYYSLPKYGHSHTKQVLTFFDAMHEELPAYFPSTRQTLQLKRSAIQQAKAIICISETSRKALEKHYDVAGKMIETIYLSTTPKPLISDQRLSTQRPFILYVGQMAGYKNFNRFYKSFLQSKYSSQYQVVVASNEPLDPKLMPYFNDRNDKICTPNQDDLNQLYQRCSLFVYPSLMEGFGIPILEAISNNANFVCSNIGAFREIIGNQPKLMFDPTDSTSISRAITDNLNHTNSKKILDYAKIMNKFSVSNLAKSTYHFYERVLNA